MIGCVKCVIIVVVFCCGCFCWYNVFVLVGLDDWIIFMCRVYLASCYAARDVVREVVLPRVEGVGAVVEAKWLSEPYELNSGATGAALGYDDDTVLGHVSDDVADVAGSDVVLCLTPSFLVGLEGFEGFDVKDPVLHSGGRHVEMGLGMALGKRVIVVGDEPENIFQRGVDFVGCLEDALEILSGLVNDNNSGVVDGVVLAIIGKKRVGKDTAASGLVRDGWCGAKFAQLLKDCLSVLDPMVGYDSELGGVVRYNEALGVSEDVAKGSVYGGEVRRLMQTFGTEVGREMFGRDFWVDSMLSGLRGVSDDIVVTDARFPNELKALEEFARETSRRFVTIRVVSPFVDNKDSHSSETSLDDYVTDYLVCNDGSVDDLVRNVKNVVMKNEESVVND